MGSKTFSVNKKEVLDSTEMMMTKFFVLIVQAQPFYIINFFHLSFRSQFTYTYDPYRDSYYLVWILHIFDLNIKPFNNQEQNNNQSKDNKLPEEFKKALPIHAFCWN